MCYAAQAGFELTAIISCLRPTQLMIHFNVIVVWKPRLYDLFHGDRKLLMVQFRADVKLG